MDLDPDMSGRAEEYGISVPDIRAGPGMALSCGNSILGHDLLTTYRAFLSRTGIKERFIAVWLALDLQKKSDLIVVGYCNDQRQRLGKESQEKKIPRPLITLPS